MNSRAIFLLALLLILPIAFPTVGENCIWDSDCGEGEYCSSENFCEYADSSDQQAADSPQYPPQQGDSSQDDGGMPQINDDSDTLDEYQNYAETDDQGEDGQQGGSVDDESESTGTEEEVGSGQNDPALQHGDANPGGAENDSNATNEASTPISNYSGEVEIPGQEPAVQSESTNSGNSIEKNSSLDFLPMLGILALIAFAAVAAFDYFKSKK